MPSNFDLIITAEPPIAKLAAPSLRVSCRALLNGVLGYLDEQRRMVRDGFKPRFMDVLGTSETGCEGGRKKCVIEAEPVAR